jgi:hypothetical protein
VEREGWAADGSASSASLKPAIQRNRPGLIVPVRGQRCFFRNRGWRTRSFRSDRHTVRSHSRARRWFPLTSPDAGYRRSLRPKAVTPLRCRRAPARQSDHPRPRETARSVPLSATALARSGSKNEPGPGCPSWGSCERGSRRRFSPFSEDLQPDSKRIGSENRRATSNGNLDTLPPTESGTLSTFP